MPGNPMWDDFNKRRNAAIRSQGFTTKESAKGPVRTAVGGMQPAAGLSQDATNAYLQSIGVAPQGVANAPQYAAQAVAYAPRQGLPAMQPMPQPQVGLSGSSGACDAQASLTVRCHFPSRCNTCKATLQRITWLPPCMSIDLPRSRTRCVDKSCFSFHEAPASSLGEWKSCWSVGRSLFLLWMSTHICLTTLRSRFRATRHTSRRL